MQGLDDLPHAVPTAIVNERPEVTATAGHSVWIGPPATVASDSHAAVRMAKNPTSIRNRHLDVRLQFVRDAVDYGQTACVYVPTALNPADCLTKACGSDVIAASLPIFTGVGKCPSLKNIYE